MEVCRFRYMSRRRQRLLFALLLAGVGAALTVILRTLFRHVPVLQWLRDAASMQGQYMLPFALLVLLVFAGLFALSYGIPAVLSSYLSDRQGILIFGPAYVELWRMAQCDVFAYDDVLEIRREVRGYTVHARHVKGAPGTARVQNEAERHAQWPVYTMRTRHRTYRMATSMLEYGERLAAHKSLREPLSLEVALELLEQRSPHCRTKANTAKN